MKYQDLFIDFDDTLYDTHGNAVIALRELFEAFDLGRFAPDAKVFYDAYWEANIDLWTRYAKEEITREYLIIERFRRPLDAIGALSEDKDYTDYIFKMSDTFLDFCSTKPGVVEGAHELMEHLRNCGYRMHMTSNGFHEVQYKKLKASGLTDYFDTIVLSEDAGANKPSADFFDYAFRVTGAKKESTLMIGDNFNTDILGALDAGIPAIFFNRYPEYPAPPNLKGAPTFTEVSSLLEIKRMLNG